MPRPFRALFRVMTFWQLVSALLLTGNFAAGPAAARGQILQGLRDDVRDGVPDNDDEEEDAPRPSSRNRSRNNDDCDDDCDDDDSDGSLATLLGLGAVFAVTSPYWLPRWLADDHDWSPGYFACRPYDGDLVGNMLFETDEPMEAFPWLLRLRADAGSDFDQLSLTSGQVLFDTASRLGMDSRFDYRQEEFRGSGGGKDGLWTGDCNAVVRFAQSSWLQVRSGVGVNWLADDLGNEFGFNFTYSTDLMPAPPWVFSSELDWGWLGEAGLFHFRVTAGVLYRRTEAYAGYDYFDVGNTQINSLVAGVGFWY